MPVICIPVFCHSNTLVCDLQMMLSVYILPTSKRSIRVSAKTQAAIVAGVNAPNDDLFDQAEEEVLKRLQPIWKLSLKQDLTRMRQVSHKKYECS